MLDILTTYQRTIELPRFDKEFLERIRKDKTKSYVEDLTPESDIMLIAFGGIKGKLGIPPFEFFKSTSSYYMKKIYIREINQAWYHQGLSGIGTDIDAISMFLKKKDRGTKSKKNTSN